MPDVLVLWGDTLKSISYDAHETVEEFSDRFFYSFSDDENVVPPCGQFKWREKVMQSDLLMVNYPIEEDDIIIYHNEAPHRIDVLIDVKGSPTLLILHFDESTTVKEMKRNLLSKLTGSMANIPLERLMLSYEGMVMNEDTFTLMEFGVKPSSLLRAKEIPEEIKASLKRDLYELKFNGKCKNVLQNRFPVENVHITVGVHDAGHPESFEDSVVISCHELNADESRGSLPWSIVGKEALSSGYKVTFLLGETLHFDAHYRLEIQSKSSAYDLTNNSVTVEFKTRPRYGNICFSGNKIFFNFTVSPLPTAMPIVHSFLHLLRKHLFSLPSEVVQGNIDEILQEIVGFEVVYETAFAANFFSLCSNKGAQELSAPEIYLIENDALQEDLQLEYYENGFDIFVKVLIRSEAKASAGPLVTLAADNNIHDNPFHETVVDEVSTEPTSLDIEEKGLSEMEQIVNALNNGLLSVNISGDDTPANVSPAIVMEPVVELSAPVEDLKEDDVEDEAFPAMSDDQYESDKVDGSSNLMEDKGEEEVREDAAEKEAIPADDEEDDDEEDEVRSVSGHLTDVSNRQVSDGSSMMSVLEFVEDGYLVLMPVDALDHSILEVDDVEIADIIVDH